MIGPMALNHTTATQGTAGWLDPQCPLEPAHRTRLYYQARNPWSPLSWPTHNCWVPIPVFLGRTERKSPLNWEGDGFMPSKELGWSFLMSQVDEFLLEHRKN